MRLVHVIKWKQTAEGISAGIDFIEVTSALTNPYLFSKGIYYYDGVRWKKLRYVRTQNTLVDAMLKPIGIRTSTAA